MKKLLALLLAIPLTLAAAEHSGKAMKNKAGSQRSSEHAGKAADHRQAKPDNAREHAGKAAPQGREAQGKRQKEHAGSPIR